MQIAFSTTDPTVVAAWQATKDRCDAMWAEAHAFAAEYDAEAIVVNRGYRIALLGIKANVAPSNAWRYNKKFDVYVADKRTKEGRQIDKRITAIVAKDVRMLPGMPDIAFDSRQGRWYEAQIGDIEGTVWVAWNCTLGLLRENTWNKNHLDEGMWQHRPLSEFYAAEEAHEARKVNAGG